MFNHQPFGITALWKREVHGEIRQRCRKLCNLGYRPVEAILGVGLKKVIHCIDFEGLDRIPIIRRRKDNTRHMIDALQYFESIGSRHLDIQENQIGFDPINVFDRLNAIVAFAGKKKRRVRCKILLDQYPGRLFVVNNKDRFS